MRKFPVVLAFMLLVAGPSVLRAALLIDYSPDTTGAEVLYTNLTNSLVNPAIFAGRFTLDEEAFITGGAIFSYNSYGVVGTAVWFLIYADEEPEPVVSILTELDVVDDTDATTAEWLNRKHASIPATYLPAGTYWFGLPANTDPNFVQGTGSFGDNEIRKSGPISSPWVIYDWLGKPFFQLEGEPVPEPGPVALLTVAGCAMAFCRRRISAR